jgi:oxygen-dependent protoporphyrinogen oxidase
MSRRYPWIVVGGGASGLASAFFLRQLGLDSVVVEQGSAVGGRMGTVRLGNRSLDCGGKNIGRGYTLFRQFAASLGTHPLEHFGLNSSQVVDGHIATFDGSARWRTMAGLARGLSAKDAVRFGRLLWKVTSDESTGYLGSPYARALADRYGALRADEYFSPAFCQRFIRPMTVGMNGAEPDEAYVSNLPSNVRMILDTYEQFSNGLAPLLASFVQRYDVRLDTATEGLVVERGRVTGVQVRDGDGRTGELRGAGVILATPANAAAALTEPVLPGLAAELRSVAYYPVTLVLAEYDRPVFSSAVRALVFGRDEVISNAGAYGIDDLHLVRYTFSGRASRRWITDRTSPCELLARAEAALARHIQFNPEGRRRFVATHFRTGLCAYTPAHGRFVGRVSEELGQVDGLHLTGDYMQGASIEACFRSASACAERIARREQSSGPASAGCGSNHTSTLTRRGPHHSTRNGDRR